MKKYILIALAVLTLVAMFVSPVHAIANPDSISLGYWKVFYDVMEAGDMLFVVEGKVTYAVEPIDYTASEAFSFDVLNAAGTAILYSIPLQEYGDRPIGFYLSAASVTAKPMVVGTAYKVRITGNPLIFPSQIGNTITQTLNAADYVDQNLGTDSDPPTDNKLYRGIITVAKHMEATDSPADPYLILVDGYRYLTNEGASLFMMGIQRIHLMCPIAFQSVARGVTNMEQEDTATYQSTLNILQNWGATSANGLTMLGSWMGISQKLAGSVVLFVIGIAFAIFIYQQTESGVVVLLAIAAIPAVGAYLGLMPIALAFVMVIFIIVLLGYFFFSKGAL